MTSVKNIILDLKEAVERGKVQKGFMKCYLDLWGTHWSKTTEEFMAW